MEDKNFELRQDFIKIGVKSFYDKFPILHTETLDELTEKALNKYLYSNMSDREIADAMYDEVLRRQKESLFKDGRKKFIELLAKSLYDDNPVLHDESLEDLTARAMEKYSTPNVSGREIIDGMNGYVESVKKKNEFKDNRRFFLEILAKSFYDEYAVLRDQSLSSYKSKIVNEYIDRDMSDKDIIADIYAGIINIQSEVKTEPVVEQVSEPVTTPVISKQDELNVMLSEVPKKEIKDVPVVEKPKELVKENNNDNKGFVSLFSVTMTLLVITGMVLVTMILLTLMK